MENPLTSIWSNIAQKSRNPFLGTFALVWFARNWEVVYAFFAFEKGRSIEQKVAFIDNYLRYGSFEEILGELGINVAWAMGILVGTYALINFARIITNLFEKRLTPIIYKWTDFKSLVPKHEYESILIRMEGLQQKLDKEIQEKLRAQNERDDYEEKYNIGLLNKSKPEDLPIQESESRDLNKITDGFDNEVAKYTLELVKNQNPIWSGTKYEAVGLSLFSKGYLNNRRNSDKGTHYTLTKLGEELLRKLDEQSKESMNFEDKVSTTEFQKMANEYSFDIMDQILSDIIEDVPIDYGKQYYIVDEFMEQKLIILKSEGKKQLHHYLLTQKGENFFNEYFTPK